MRLRCLMQGACLAKNGSHLATHSQGGGGQSWAPIVWPIRALFIPDRRTNYFKANWDDIGGPDSRAWSGARPTTVWTRMLRLATDMTLTCHELFTSTVSHICPDILHCLDVGSAHHLTASVITSCSCGELFPKAHCTSGSQRCGM